MTIPDLRAEQKEVTLEHCSVLLEKLYGALGEMYDGDVTEFKGILDHMDVYRMKRDFLSVFSEEAFLNLFSTEFGKGVMIGAFIEKFIFGEE